MPLHFLRYEFNSMSWSAKSERTFALSLRFYTGRLLSPTGNSYSVSAFQIGYIVPTSSEAVDSCRKQAFTLIQAGARDPLGGGPFGSEFEARRQDDCGIGPPSIEDVGSEIQTFVREAREKSSLHIKRCLICTGSLRSQAKANPVGR